MATRNKLSMLKAVFKDLEIGLNSLSYDDFEEFGNLLNSISQTFDKVEDSRLDEAEEREQKKLDAIKARKKAKADKK